LSDDIRTHRVDTKQLDIHSRADGSDATFDAKVNSVSVLITLFIVKQKSTGLCVA